jgi:alpha/beta superfamily hydrolase
MGRVSSNVKVMADEKPVAFTNKRRQQLIGVLHLPQETKNPPVIVMSHGFTDDKVCDNRLFVRFARQAGEQGFAVLRFDFAGSGDSEGEFADMTVSGEIQDLESALDFVSRFSGLNDSLIYLVGYSLGGAVALSVAARDPRVKGCVGWAPVSHLETVFRGILGEEAFAAAAQGCIVRCRNGEKNFFLKPAFFSDLKRHAPMSDIARLTPRPALLIQGTEDTKVLPCQTRALYEAAGEPKTLQHVEGAPHAFTFHEEKLFDITLRHLARWSERSRKRELKKAGV